MGLLDTSLYTHSAAYLKPEGVLVSTGPQPLGFDVLGIIRFLWDVFLHPRFLGGTKRAWRYVSSFLQVVLSASSDTRVNLTSRMVQVKHRREDLERICEHVAQGESSPLTPFRRVPLKRPTRPQGGCGLLSTGYMHSGTYTLRICA